MASNPYNNKVELSDGTVLMDLTGDTVTPQTMIRGTTAHDRSGASITGVVDLANAGDNTPLSDNASGAAGTAIAYSREDHRHPFDASVMRVVTTDPLTNADDLNDYTTVGLYRIGGTQPAHCPNVSWAVLMVTCVGTTWYQTIFTTAIDMYIFQRSGSSSGWNDWKQISDVEINNNTSNISTLMTYGLRVISTNPLVSSNNLNDYTSIGLYRIGGSIPSNCPTGVTWSILMVTSVDTTIYQTIFAASNLDFSIYQRTKGSPNWNSWNKISASDILSNTSNISTLMTYGLRVISTDPLVSTNDLNDYTSIGLYRIGGSTPSNCPTGVTWSILMVTSVDTTYLQTIFKTNGTSLEIYQRTTGSGGWNAWQKISSSDIDSLQTTVGSHTTDLANCLKIVSTTALTSSDNLNNCTTNGLYRIGASTPSNCPTGITWSVLFVTSVDTTRMQTIYRTTGSAMIIYQRSGGSNSWNAWQKISSSDIDSLQTTVGNHTTSIGTLQTDVGNLQTAMADIVSVTPTNLNANFEFVQYDVVKYFNKFIIGTVILKCNTTTNEGGIFKMPAKSKYSFITSLVTAGQWDRGTRRVDRAYYATDGWINMVKMNAGEYATIEFNCPL